MRKIRDWLASRPSPQAVDHAKEHMDAVQSVAAIGRVEVRRHFDALLSEAFLSVLDDDLAAIQRPMLAIEPPHDWLLEIQRLRELRSTARALQQIAEALTSEAQPTAVQRPPRRR